MCSAAYLYLGGSLEIIKSILFHISIYIFLNFKLSKRSRCNYKLYLTAYYTRYITTIIYTRITNYYFITKPLYEPKFFYVSFYICLLNLSEV